MRTVSSHPGNTIFTANLTQTDLRYKNSTSQFDYGCCTGITIEPVFASRSSFDYCF